MADAGNILVGKVGRRIRNRPINFLHLRHGKSHSNILINDERPQ